ncbi:MAG: helix-turn-helix transcriptional regulator [Clostridia bacterium]|nr:helix-turn-helix transcriptional regulator [Clostridia bacterium]
MAQVTERLLKALENARDLEGFFRENENEFMSITTAQYLSDILKLREITVAEAAKRAGLGEYAYKIFLGDRHPSRDVLIALSFGMNLSVDETQLLMRISKFASLDPRDKRDSTIIYGLTHGLNVFELDDILEQHNLVTVNK